VLNKKRKFQQEKKLSFHLGISSIPSCKPSVLMLSKPNKNQSATLKKVLELSELSFKTQIRKQIKLAPSGKQKLQQS